MLWAWRVIAAIAVAAANGVAALARESEDGRAQEAYAAVSTGSAARGPEWFWSFQPLDVTQARRAAKRTVAFAGTDIWRQGTFLYGGSLWVPKGLDQDGFVLKLIATRGYYRYRSGTLGDATVTGMMYAASVMPGLRFTRGGVTVNVHAGLDYQVHALFPDDPGSRTRGWHRGVRTAFDLWYQPTPTTMVTAAATLTTVVSGYAARAAFGWRLLERFYVGPEAMIYGDSNYRQLRVGAHLTGLDLLWFEWQAGVGYAADDDGHRGLYVRLAISDKW
jgi:hypothetical protein